LAAETWASQNRACVDAPVSLLQAQQSLLAIFADEVYR